MKHSFKITLILLIIFLLAQFIGIAVVYNYVDHDKSVKEGNLVADIDLNFDDQGELTNIFDIKGSIKNGKIGLLNKKKY